jgi:hypothetical protein
VEKESVFYFDVADDSRSYFADAFSVASMPETTAIAWRYGVDRYDLYRVTEFKQLLALLKEKDLPIENIHSFFYSRQRLVNTTDVLRKMLKTKSIKQKIDFSIEEEQDNILITPKNKISSILPNEFELQIRGIAKSPNDLLFPFTKNPKLQTNIISKSDVLRELAFEYKTDKQEFVTKTKVATSSNWRENLGQNLIDNDTNTLWQSDRVLWGQGQEAVITLDLGESITIDRLVWVNAYANNSPTVYKIESSLDGKNWSELKEVNINSRIESTQRQIISFPTTTAKFVKLRFLKSLNLDSPGIAEIWVVDTKYKELDINQLEEFINEPFGFLPSAKSYEEVLRELNFIGEIDVYWKNNKSDIWMNLEHSKFSLRYNSDLAKVSFILPAGGTEIKMIKLVPKVPGDLIIDNIFVKYLNLEEMNETTRADY